MPRPEIYLEPKARMLQILELLEKAHPNAQTALNHTNSLEMLVATILSAQNTDAGVNKLTQTLFKKYRKPEDYANADVNEFAQDIHSISFSKGKARNIKQTCKILIEKYNGQVPCTMDELIELPGIARKTANVILYNACGKTEGVAVDTHVKRLSQRLGLTDSDKPAKIELTLMELAPHDKWMRLSDLLICHGRQVCTARKPNCAGCVLNKICPCAFCFE